MSKGESTSKEVTSPLEIVLLKEMRSSVPQEPKYSRLL